METPALDTTNLLLGIMAAVSVLEALLLVVVAVLGYRLYTQTLRTVRDLEQRQIAPLVANVAALMARVDAILTDVKDMTGRVTRRAERVDSAIHTTTHRVGETADRVRSSVASRLQQIAAVVHGARSVIAEFFTGRAASRTS